ncbi:hypothetical protein VPH35_119725 [Triticum aestivum]
MDRSIYPPVFLLLLSHAPNNLASSTTVTGGFVYSGFSSTDGTATVTPDGVLTLTSGAVRKGHAFYPTPWRFRGKSTFSATFVFGMVPVSPDANQCTDGMAFLISPSKDFSGAHHSQYLGLLNKTNDGKASNRLFAVKLDSSQNMEFEDVDDNHVGIDVNSLTSIKSQPAGFYDDDTNVFTSLSLVSRRDTMQVWVDYDGDTARISVTLAPLKVSKPSRPLVSATYNLSKVLQDEWSYVRFSASTDRPALDIDITKLPKLPRIGTKPHQTSKVLKIVLPIATATFIFIVGTCMVVSVRRRMRYAELHEDWEDEFGPHRFSYKDLFDATQGFHSKTLLGHGGFGKVYKGVLPVSRLEVAVKRVSHESKQGMKEFIAEIVSIGRLRHRNIVQLLGYYLKSSEVLRLAYSTFMRGGRKLLSTETLKQAMCFLIVK